MTEELPGYIYMMGTGADPAAVQNLNDPLFTKTASSRGVHAECPAVRLSRRLYLCRQRQRSRGPAVRDWRHACG